MKLSAENYTPQTRLSRLRKQARKVWGVSSAVVFAWVFLILLAPVAAGSYGDVSAPLYKFFSYVCHQQTERSFHFAAHPFAVCARCFGIYFGLLTGFIVYPFFRGVENVEPLPRAWLFAAMIPMGIDWALGAFDIWANTHLSRFATGAILGAACAIYIIPALVEIFRLLGGKNRFQTK